MNWSAYFYLGLAALLAVVLVVVMSRFMPKLTKASKNRTKEEIAFLVVTAALGLFVIYGLFYIERLYWAYGIGDIGSDTIEQYIPFYANLIGNVRDGSLSTWSFEYELGVNNAGYQSWIYDPFNLILIPLGLLLGDAHLSLALVLTQSVKLMLSALLFDHLLTRFCEVPISRMLGALLYAFSGFMVLYGQHYWFGAAFPLFTWAMLAFELYLEKCDAPRFLSVTFVVAILMTWTVYVSFMVLLFAALYLLVRIPSYIEKCTPRNYLLRVVQLCIPVICGCLLSCITSLPYITFLLSETSRTSSSSSLTERLATALASFINVSWFPAVLSRFLGSGLVNTGLNPDTPCVPGVWDIGGFTYEFIMMGYSVFAFVLIGQFLHYIFTDTPKRVRIQTCFGIGFVVLYCFHQFFPTLFTAMVRLQYRSSFVLAFPVCTAMAIGFEKRILNVRVAKVPFIISIVITFIVLLWSLLNTVNGRLLCLYYLAVLVFVCILVYVLCQQKFASFQTLVLILLVGSVVSTSVVDGFFTTNSRLTVGGPAFPLSGKTDHDKGTVAALAWLAEHDDSFYRVDKTYSDWSPLNDSLIQHFDGVSAYNSTPDSDVDELYNKLWNSAISTWAVYSQGFKNSPDSPEVLSLLNVKYILSKDELSYDWLSLETQIEDVYVYRNMGADSIATIRSSIVSELDADVLESEEERVALLANSIIVPESIASTAASFPELTEPAQSEFKKIDETHIEGSITVADRAAVCIAVPNTGNWVLTVDGEEVETVRGDYGFIAFPIAGGTHTVELVYHLPHEKLALGLSIFGVVLTASVAFCLRRNPKQKPGHMAVLE